MEIDGKHTWKTDKNRQNSSLLPQDIRGLIVGSSNCGNTTLILNLLLKPGWLDYDHLFVFGRSLHQKEYQHRSLFKGKCSHHVKWDTNV